MKAEEHQMLSASQRNTHTHTHTLRFLFFKTIFVPLSARLLLHFPSIYFGGVTDWGGWVVMATGSQYVARMQAAGEPEKEQPTSVAMATHLLQGALGSSSFLRLPVPLV